MFSIQLGLHSDRKITRLTMNCNVCNSTYSKYKCPRCRIPYCSVSCWKAHQSTECKAVEIQEDITEETEECKYETEDTVPAEKLKLLENNKNLINILKNPHLREMLVNIDKSSNPESSLCSAMQDPVFVAFADECLRTVEPVEHENMHE